MDIKLLTTVFVTIFLAEIADKTQIATLLYATNAEHSKLIVFAGAALALICATILAVFAGSLLGNWIDAKWMSRIAGGAFIIVGVWTLFRF